MADLSKHIPMAESFAGRADDAGRMARSFLAAIARLAAVEALCSDRDEGLCRSCALDVRAAARGEGDRPAEHAFAPSPVADECIAWRTVPGDGSICGLPADHPIHSGSSAR